MIQRRSLLATLVMGALMAETIDAQAQPATDPENTLDMDLKQGRVVIAMCPDMAPKAVERIKSLTRRDSTITRRSIG